MISQDNINDIVWCIYKNKAVGMKIATLNLSSNSTEYGVSTAKLIVQEPTPQSKGCFTVRPISEIYISRDQLIKNL